MMKVDSKQGFYVGWIMPTIKESVIEKKFLEDLGIKVGKYNEGEKEFDDCVVSVEALERLDKYWGRFIWGLSFTKRKNK